MRSARALLSSARPLTRRRYCCGTTAQLLARPLTESVARRRTQLLRRLP
jgi:hypothetical protein